MSEIKVDKLQGTSGSTTAITLSGANATLGGTLAVTGIHTVGTNAVATSDGGAVTTSVVQGLLKLWINYATDGSAQDSLNVSSTTDSSTAGITTVNINNNMNSGNYVFLAGGSNYYYQNCTATLSTGSFPCYTSVVNGTVADAKGYVAASGDLA